jgi:hypothetical protein
MAVTMASLGLLLAYGDDDDWKKREDWDRDTYWWFKIGGIAYRVPKPFEIGAVATLAERSAELIFDKEMTGERFRKVTKDLVWNQLSMNPVPQAAKPIIDLYANKDSFTGRTIESMSMQRLDPEHRYNANTTLVARGASAAIGGALSPVQVDHVVRAYFGWLGAFAVGSADMVVRGASDEPTKPARDYFKFASGGMVAELDSASSRYVTHIYDQAKVLEEAYATYNKLKKDGKVEEAKEYREDNKEKLDRYRSVENIKQQMSALNEKIRMIERDTRKDPDKKRAEINYLRRQQDRISRKLAPTS